MAQEQSASKVDEGYEGWAELPANSVTMDVVVEWGAFTSLPTSPFSAKNFPFSPRFEVMTLSVLHSPTTIYLSIRISPLFAVSSCVIKLLFKCAAYLWRGFPLFFIFFFGGKEGKYPDVAVLHLFANWIFAGDGGKWRKTTTSMSKSKSEVIWII